MIIKNKKDFYIGLVMTIVFISILVVMNLPIFNGTNGFQFADNLFNSISKGSSYKIPDLEQKAFKFKGTEVNWQLPKNKLYNIELTKLILKKAGVTILEDEKRIFIKGDLGAIAISALNDAKNMYFNKENELKSRYTASGKEVLYAWWKALRSGELNAKKQKNIVVANYLSDITKKAIEVGYNFYKIPSEKASTKMGILSASLIFYVFYTMWWGYAILYLFNGFGLVMAAGKKEEV